ncbi:MAG: hypothetical protein HKM89_04905, partial [Gemmatimonadales bacterium]|nr:hypothetical protein [Gemmatimonadales bacterium]
MSDSAVPNAKDLEQPKIGRDDCAVRALTFAGGGFDTVMQMGVIHALLVIRGRAPDAVVGVSAGAVNAAALAEVLQAGEEFERCDRPGFTTEELHRRVLEARVARFRLIMDEYKRAPRDVVDALLPDAFQVEARRPLEPIDHPVHDQRERDARREAMESRAGLINLYNALLKVRVRFSTLTLAIRRWLGLKAAADVRSPVGRWLSVASELAWSWIHIGRNLGRIAPSLHPLLEPLFKAKARRSRGATAAGLIFRWRIWTWLKQSFSHAVLTVLVVVMWGAISFLVLGLPLIGLGYVATSLSDHYGSVLRSVFIFIIYGLVVLTVLAFLDRKTTPPAFRRLAGKLISFVSHALRSLKVPGLSAAAAVVPLVAWAALSFRILWQWRAESESVLETAGITALVVYGVLLATVLVFLYRDRAWFSRSGSWIFAKYSAMSVGTLLILFLLWSLMAWMVVIAATVLAWTFVSAIDWIVSAARARPIPDVRTIVDPEFTKNVWAFTKGILPYLANVLWLLALSVAAAGLWVFLRGRHRGYVRNLLAGYDLAGGLFHPHALRQFFVALFDREYYGAVNMDDVVERTLGDDRSPRDNASSVVLSDDCTPWARKRPKVVGDYARTKPPIHVGLGVADVESGQLEVVPNETKVVDGLLAAVAVTPLFPPQRIGERLFIDGTNIANEPTRSLLWLLRDRVNEDSKVVHIYSVASLPFSHPLLGEEREPYLNLREAGLPLFRHFSRYFQYFSHSSLRKEPEPYLTLVDVTLRAQRLRRLRDAALERRLTQVVTRAMPSDGAVHLGKSKRKYVRAWVTPIETDAPIVLNQRLMLAPEKERRILISETVADGCRAALEAMIRPSLGGKTEQGVLKCRLAVEEHLEKRGRVANGNPDLYVEELPGSSTDSGPGLREICDRCAILRRRVAIAPFTQFSGKPALRHQYHSQSLVVTPWENMGPAWPHEREEGCEPLSDDPH